MAHEYHPSIEKPTEASTAERKQAWITDQVQLRRAGARALEQSLNNMPPTDQEDFLRTLVDGKDMALSESEQKAREEARRVHPGDIQNADPKVWEARQLMHETEAIKTMASLAHYDRAIGAHKR